MILDFQYVYLDPLRAFEPLPLPRLSLDTLSLSIIVALPRPLLAPAKFSISMSLFNGLSGLPSSS